MKKRCLLDIRNVQDYYAAITWLHHDFAVGVDDNLAYMDSLMDTWMKLRLTNRDIDTLDIAWEKSEASGDFSTFERTIHRVLKGLTNA